MDGFIQAHKQGCKASDCPLTKWANKRGKKSSGKGENGINKIKKTKTLSKKNGDEQKDETKVKHDMLKALIQRMYYYGV